MATVIGGRIVNLPAQNLAGLFGGAGEVLQGINQVRAQTADKQRFDDLNRVLAGDTLPADQAGPVRPGITDPQERLRATLGVIPDLQVPRNQEIALEIAKIEERAIPTGAAGKTGFGVTMNNALRAIGVKPSEATTEDFTRATEFRRKGELQQARAIETAKVEAQTGAELAAPLFQTNTAFARTLVDAQTGGPIDPGTTGAQFRENPNQFVSVTEAQKRDLTKINQVVNLTEQANELVNNIFPEEEGRIAGATRRTLANLSQSDPDVVEFNRLRKAMAGPLTRAMGEVGNLAEQEQQRALGILPKDTDSPEVAKRLMALTTGLVQNMRGVILRGGQESDVNTVINEAAAQGEALRTGGTPASAPSTPSTSTTRDISGLSPAVQRLLRGE